MSASDEPLFSIQNVREHETVLRPHREGAVRMCWKKLDRKSKKLNFNFQVSDMNSNQLAGQDTLEVLNMELAQIQERLDSISRNVYLQQDMDKEHFECKFSHVFINLLCLVTSSSASTQTWMSILKMILVLGVCAGQVYFITSFFSSQKGGTRVNANPFAGRNVI